MILKLAGKQLAGGCQLSCETFFFNSFWENSQHLQTRIDVLMQYLCFICPFPLSSDFDRVISVLKWMIKRFKCNFWSTFINLNSRLLTSHTNTPTFHIVFMTTIKVQACLCCSNKTTSTHNYIVTKRFFMDSKSFIFLNPSFCPLYGTTLLIYFFPFHPCLQCFLLPGAMEGSPEWMVNGSICSSCDPWEGPSNMKIISKKALKYIINLATADEDTWSSLGKRF